MLLDRGIDSFLEVTIELENTLTTLDTIEIVGVACMESMAFELLSFVSSILFISFVLTLSLNTKDMSRALKVPPKSNFRA